MAPASAVALARAATALQAALPAAASSTQGEPPAAPWQPGAEGTLLGLDDAEWYLTRARAALAKDFAELAKPGPLVLRRELAGAEVQDRVYATPERLALVTRGLDWQVWRDASGCAASLQGPQPPGGAFAPPAGVTATTACPPHSDQALALVGALLAVSRADLAPQLQVEALHSGGGTSLRLAIPAWRLRFRLRFDAQGQPQALELPAQAAVLRVQRGEGPPQLAAYLRGEQLAWRWQPGALAPGKGGPSLLRLPAEGPGIAMSDGAALEALLQRFSAAAAAAQATPLGPISVEARKVAGQWRAVGVEAALLAGPPGRAVAGLQVADADRQAGPLVAVALLGAQDPAAWLQQRPEECLILSVLRRGSLTEAEAAQITARSCVQKPK